MMLHPTQAYHAQRLLTFIVASQVGTHLKASHRENKCGIGAWDTSCGDVARLIGGVGAAAPNEVCRACLDLRSVLHY